MLALARNPDHLSAEPTMAESAYDTDLCLRVLARHGVKSGALARESGVAESMLSRYLSGQFMLPLRVFAALWRLTRDPELLALLASDDALVVPVRLEDIHHGEHGEHGEENLGFKASDPTRATRAARLPITPSPNHPLRPQPRPAFFAAHPRGVTA